MQKREELKDMPINGIACPGESIAPDSVNTPTKRKRDDDGRTGLDQKIKRIKTKKLVIKKVAGAFMVSVETGRRLQANGP